MNFLNNIKASVRALEVYAVKGKTAQIKLNQNENPFDIPREIKEQVVSAFLKESWNRYPETFPQDLIEAVAEYLNWPADGIIIGDGSNELMYTVMMAIVTKGTTVLLPSPSFFLYEKAARVFDANVVEVMMNEDLSYNADRFIEMSKKNNPSLIVIVSPNSPTAQSMPVEGVEQLLKQTSALVLVDEAYIEFSDKKSCFELLKKHENLILLRTLSKSFSLAGLRIGYLIAHPKIRQEILKPKIPFTVNRLSSLTAITLLKNPNVINDHIRYIKNQKSIVAQRLAELPSILVYPSDTNFFLIRTKHPAGLVMDALLNEGVLVRDVSSYPMLERCLRVNVGTEDENEKFLTTFEQVLKQLN